MDNSEKPTEPSMLDRLLSSPDVQKAIAELPSLLRANIEAKNALAKVQFEAQASLTRGTTKWILLWIAFLASIVIATVTLLAWYDKLSSDAVTFLLGTIVGAAFTFLRTFFPRGI